METTHATKGGRCVPVVRVSRLSCSRTPHVTRQWAPGSPSSLTVAPGVIEVRVRCLPLVPDRHLQYQGSPSQGLPYPGNFAAGQKGATGAVRCPIGFQATGTANSLTSATPHTPGHSRVADPCCTRDSVFDYRNPQAELMAAAPKRPSACTPSSVGTVRTQGTEITAPPRVTERGFCWLAIARTR